MKIYLAGPLFSEAEINQREMEAFVLRNLKHEVYNPIEYNKSGGPLDPPSVYKKDHDELLSCDIVIADISNEDSGTIVELTQAIAYNKRVYVYDSDFRGRRNKYLEGMLMSVGIEIHNSFLDATTEMENDHE